MNTDPSHSDGYRKLKVPHILYSSDLHWGYEYGTATRKANSGTRPATSTDETSEAATSTDSATLVRAVFPNSSPVSRPNSYYSLLRSSGQDEILSFLALGARLIWIVRRRNSICEGSKTECLPKKKSYGTETSARLKEDFSKVFH